MWLGVNHILADTKTAVIDEKVEIRGFKMFLKRKYLQNWFKFVKNVAFPRKLATIVGCNFEQSTLFLLFLKRKYLRISTNLPKFIVVVRKFESFRCSLNFKPLNFAFCE